MIKTDWIKKDFIEELADLEHQQWSHWTKYFLSNFDKQNVERWSAQIKIPYKMLSEKEKESDRIWARKVVKLIDDKIKRLENMYKTLENMQKATEKIIKENLRKQKNAK